MYYQLGVLTEYQCSCLDNGTCVKGVSSAAAAVHSFPRRLPVGYQHNDSMKDSHPTSHGSPGEKSI